jgi:hypothetical protein
MHTYNIYILKSTKINTLKTLKNLLLRVLVPFLRLSSGGSWTVLCQVTKLRSVDIRSLWNCAVCGRMLFKTTFRGLVDSTLSSYQVEICWCTFVTELCGMRLYGIRQQTAQFYNQSISTDLSLVTWQSTVHGPPEGGLENGTESCRGKFLSVLM